MRARFWPPIFGWGRCHPRLWPSPPPTVEVLREGHQAHTLGGDVVRVWRQQARRPGHAGLLELARAWQISIETGAPMSSTLDQVAASLAADQALTQVVNSELAAARATGKVMAVLPGCGIGIGYLLGGDPARWLLAGTHGLDMPAIWSSAGLCRRAVD